MRLVREIKVGDRTVLVRELTVAEIREWLLAKTADLGDLVDVSLFDDFSLSDVAALTNLTHDDLDQMLPSEIVTVMDVAREINPRFFEMRARMVTMGRALTESQSALPTSSVASPA